MDRKAKKTGRVTTENDLVVDEVKVITSELGSILSDADRAFRSVDGLISRLSSMEKKQFRTRLAVESNFKSLFATRVMMAALVGAAVSLKRLRPLAVRVARAADAIGDTGDTGF